MNFDGPVVYGFLGIVMAGLVAFAWHSYFSPEARERKRRRRSYGRVISRAHRPMVRLSVRTR